MSKCQVALERLRNTISRGKAIVGGGAGVGLSAKTQEAGGVDLIILYNSGRYRMAGRGSLAMAGETLTVVKHTPVLAGTCGTDPFRNMSRLLQTVKDLGFTGVQNFPTGIDRRETGMDYGKEVEMIRLAHEMDLLTTPYVFSVDDARRMTEADADVVVAHMGLTTSGTIGAQTALTLDDCVERVGDIAKAAKGVRPDVVVLCHGGPIATPEHAQCVIERVNGVHGFFGASSLERLPVETAMKRVTEEFKSIRLKL